MATLRPPSVAEGPLARTSITSGGFVGRDFWAALAAAGIDSEAKSRSHSVHTCSHECSNMHGMQPCLIVCAPTLTLVKTYVHLNAIIVC